MAQFLGGRSAGEQNWQESLGLSVGNRPISIGESLGQIISRETKAVAKNIQGFGSYLIQSATGTVEKFQNGIHLLLSQPNGNNTMEGVISKVEKLGSNVSTSNDSTVWIHSLVDMPQGTNYVRFTYQFNETGNGYLTVYFNGNLILIGDQRFDSNQPHDSGPIMVANMMQDYNWLTFRLDPIGQEQTDIFISNIEVGTITNTSDLNNDLTVDFVDFATFANKWSSQDCNVSNGWCSGCDFDQSGIVDIDDLVIFVGNWLWKPSKNIKADLDLSGAVDFIDFSLFANQWSNDCNSPDWCYGSDFDHSGRVDILDLATFARYWLSGS